MALVRKKMTLKYAGVIPSTSPALFFIFLTSHKYLQKFFQLRSDCRTCQSSWCNARRAGSHDQGWTITKRKQHSYRRHLDWAWQAVQRNTRTYQFGATFQVQRNLFAPAATTRKDEVDTHLDKHLEARAPLIKVRIPLISSLCRWFYS